MKKNINQILDNENNIKIYFLPWLIVLSFLLRLIAVYFYRDTDLYSSNVNEWNILLENLIKYKSLTFYSFNGELIPSVIVPPMYAFFLYLVKVVTSFDETGLLYLVTFIQTLMSTYSIYLFYQINQNFFSNKVSLINSVIFSIIPVNVIICGQISSITLQIVFSLLFLKFLFLVMGKPINKNIFIFSMVSGLLILTRGEFLLVFSFILFFIFIKKKIKLINLTKILIVVVLVISPYVTRNYMHFDEIFIVKSLGYNLWKGNNQLSSVGGYENLERTEFIELKKKIINLKKNKYYEINRDNIFLDEAIYNLSKNPIQYFKLFLKKIFSYYFFDINSNYPNYFNFFHIVPIVILSLLSFPGLFIFYKVNKFENKCLGLYLLLNLIIFSIFFILPRYKLVILPIQIILMTYFMKYLIKKLEKT